MIATIHTSSFPFYPKLCVLNYFGYSLVKPAQGMQFAFGARNGSNDGPQCGAHAAALFLGGVVRHHFYQIVQDIPNLIAVLGNRVCAALAGQYIAATASVYVRGLPKPSCFGKDM